MRFNEDLRSAGEDHLFFFDLVVASGEVCLSTEIEVELGRGINIYRSVMSEPVKFGTLPLFSNVTEDQATSLQLGTGTPRNVLRGIHIPGAALAGLWRDDPQLFLQLPLNVFVVAVQWLLGKVRGVHPFAWTGGWTH